MSTQKSSPSSSSQIAEQQETSIIKDQSSGVTVGFIGCGTIASAIITGFLTQIEVPISSVFVSRRSESKSKALHEKYGEEMITISDDNQHIVDNSEIIFLCVLPQQEEEVLTSLNIDDEKTLVSLVVCFLHSSYLLSHTNYNSLFNFSSSYP